MGDIPNRKQMHVSNWIANSPFPEILEFSLLTITLTSTSIFSHTLTGSKLFFKTSHLLVETKITQGFRLYIGEAHTELWQSSLDCLYYVTARLTKKNYRGSIAVPLKMAVCYSLRTFQYPNMPETVIKPFHRTFNMSLKGKPTVKTSL